MNQRDDEFSRKQRRQQQKKGRKRGGWLRKAFSLCMSLGLLGIIGIGILLLYLRTETLPTAYITQTSQIYDVNGELIDAFYTGQNRQLVDIDDISPHAINATLSIEDRRFFDHFGIDVKGLGRAVAVNVINMDKVQGASTITQQLARNLYLTHERTWDRKVKEALISLQLEMQYSKEDILEQYLNQIYYGHAAYGIESAAKMYFGKSAADLTLAESALLAGVPKGPKYYSPYMDEDNAKQRQRLVLNSMVTNGFITQQEADEAYAEPLTYLTLDGDEPSEAPYFQDYVRSIAIDQIGIDERVFEEGGIKVYTTLDMRAQRIAEETVNKHLEGKELQAALISIDPRNGHIKAMVGGKDYGENQYNRVFATTRQPGSSFKAFVYLTALQQEGFSAVTTYNSAATSFSYDEGRKSYTPRNFGDIYYGDIDMRTAISKSDNIYAVNTVMQVGPEQVIETAQKLGVTAEMDPVPSLALGTFPVSPFEMASAFGVIANQGVRVEPVAILRIEDALGNVIYEAEPKEEQVVAPETTYVLTKLLESVFDQGGTGYRVSDVLKRPVAAKTGTTNWDAWMVGYTPELSTAVWVGYDRGQTINSVESVLAAPIFAEFTEQTLEPIPPKIFPIPAGVVNVYIDPESGKLATPDCPDARLEAFVAGTEPTEKCEEHGPEDAAEDASEDEAPLEPQEDRSWWEDIRRWWTG